MLLGLRLGFPPTPVSANSGKNGSSACLAFIMRGMVGSALTALCKFTVVLSQPVYVYTPGSQDTFTKSEKGPAREPGSLQKYSHQNFSTVPWGLVTLVRALDLLAESLRPTFSAAGGRGVPEL